MAHILVCILMVLNVHAAMVSIQSRRPRLWRRAATTTTCARCSDQRRISTMSRSASPTKATHMNLPTKRKYDHTHTPSDSLTHTHLTHTHTHTCRLNCSNKQGNQSYQTSPSSAQFSDKPVSAFGPLREKHYVIYKTGSTLRYCDVVRGGAIYGHT